MKRISNFCAGLLVALSVSGTAISADVPMLLNYQGRLTDPAGAPKDGTFSMTFGVYDAETGGNALPSGAPWTETQSVTVTSGVFNVLLGSVTALPKTLFESGPSDSAGPLRFLHVIVDGEPLAPRKRIASAAYAMGNSASTHSVFYAGVLAPGTIFEHESFPAVGFQDGLTGSATFRETTGALTPGFPCTPVNFTIFGQTGITCTLTDGAIPTSTAFVFATCTTTSDFVPCVDPGASSMEVPPASEVLIHCDPAGTPSLPLSFSWECRR